MMDGIIDDIRTIVSPRNQSGDLQPLAKIEIELSKQAQQKLFLLNLLSGIATGVTMYYLSKKK